MSTLAPVLPSHLDVPWEACPFLSCRVSGVWRAALQTQYSTQAKVARPQHLLVWAHGAHLPATGLRQQGVRAQMSSRYFHCSYSNISALNLIYNWYNSPKNEEKHWHRRLQLSSTLRPKWGYGGRHWTSSVANKSLLGVFVIPLSYVMTVTFGRLRPAGGGQDRMG